MMELLRTVWHGETYEFRPQVWDKDGELNVVLRRMMQLERERYNKRFIAVPVGMNDPRRVQEKLDLLMEWSFVHHLASVNIPAYSLFLFTKTRIIADTVLIKPTLAFSYYVEQMPFDVTDIKVMAKCVARRAREKEYWIKAEARGAPAGGSAEGKLC